jgi:hypothetical protein
VSFGSGTTLRVHVHGRFSAGDSLSNSVQASKQ